jgi:hypothetical protein
MANYPNQPYQPQPVVPNSNLAIVSLVMGILGWTLLPTLGAIVAIITGHMAKNEIRKSNGGLRQYRRFHVRLPVFHPTAIVRLRLKYAVPTKQLLKSIS